MDETLTVIEKTAFLKSVDMFSHVPTEVLAQLATRATEIHFEAGKVVFREGESNRGVYMMVDGLVEIRKGRALEGVRGPGMGFGELALGEGEPHQFTAVAAIHSHVLNVSNETFFDTMLDYPEVGVSMVRILARQITELGQRVHDLEGKIAHLNAALKGAGVEVSAYQSGAFRRPDPQ